MMKKVLSILALISLVCLTYMIGSTIERREFVAINVCRNIEKKDSLYLTPINTETPEFTFQTGEKAICIYEGEAGIDLKGEQLALYKETVEKDILFINILYIESNTGNIYTWDKENLILIGTLEQLEAVNIYEQENIQDLLLKNITEDNLMNDLVRVLNKNGYTNIKLIYDGTQDFANKKYHVVSTYDDFEDHIIRTQEFYIDIENGNIYIVSDNNEFMRNELYYVDNLKGIN